MEEAGQHLERGGFTGAVWAEEPDGFAGVDVERDGVDGSSVRVFAVEEAFDRTEEAGRFPVGAVDLGQVADRDGGLRHGGFRKWPARVRCRVPSLVRGTL